MFELDMNAIRQSAGLPWLMANSANPANLATQVAHASPDDRQSAPPLAKLAEIATLAISHDRLSAANDAQPLAQIATLAGLAISQELMEARLIAAAMRAADHHGDGPEAREQWRQDVLNTPYHLRADLLEHLQAQYPPG